MFPELQNTNRVIMANEEMEEKASKPQEAESTFPQSSTEKTKKEEPVAVAPADEIANERVEQAVESSPDQTLEVPANTSEVATEDVSEIEGKEPTVEVSEDFTEEKPTADRTPEEKDAFLKDFDWHNYGRGN